MKYFNAEVFDLTARCRNFTASEVVQYMYLGCSIVYDVFESKKVDRKSAVVLHGGCVNKCERTVKASVGVRYRCRFATCKALTDI